VHFCGFPLRRLQQVCPLSRSLASTAVSRLPNNMVRIYKHPHRRHSLGSGGLAGNEGGDRVVPMTLQNKLMRGRLLRFLALQGKVVVAIRTHNVFRWFLISVYLCSVGSSTNCAFASTPPAADLMPLTDAAGDTLPDAPAAKIPVTEKGLPLAILKDQISVWTSPVRIRSHDLIWLLPLGAATGVTLATDPDAMRDLSRNPGFNKDSVNASNALLGGEIAVPVALYGVGLFNGNAHARETGILSGEALADSVVLDQVTKIIFRRERPLYNNASGDFFSSNAGNNSFPSSHSMLAWAIAGVTAGEYPSKWVQLGAYSLASSVSLMRVLGQEHFPTDVLVGGAAGWLIGHYVFKKHAVHPLTSTARGKL
jgi:membrane-associated phospholipid phosphatase